MSLTFDIRQVPAQPVLLVREACTMKEIPTAVGRIFGDVMRWAGEHHVPVQGPAFARYSDMHGDRFTLEAGFAVRDPIAAVDGRVSPGRLGDCSAAHAMHIGPYEKLADTYGELQRWVASQGYEPVGDAWELYLTGPSTPPSEHRTEIFLPVRKRGAS